MRKKEIPGNWLTDAEICQMYKDGTKINILRDLTGKSKEEIMEIVKRTQEKRDQIDKEYKEIINRKAEEAEPAKPRRKKAPAKKAESIEPVEVAPVQLADERLKAIQEWIRDNTNKFEELKKENETLKKLANEATTETEALKKELRRTKEKTKDLENMLRTYDKELASTYEAIKKIGR